MNFRTNLAALALMAAGLASAAAAVTIRVAIGTQDTTINTATGGLLIRELKLLDKYLPPPELLLPKKRDRRTSSRL